MKYYKNSNFFFNNDKIEIILLFVNCLRNITNNTVITVSKNILHYVNQGLMLYIVIIIRPSSLMNVV